MKNRKISLLFRVLTPFSIIFSLSFVLIASVFNAHYGAEIDLSFVGRVADSIEQGGKKLAGSASSSIEDAKSRLYVFAEEMSAEEPEADTYAQRSSLEAAEDSGKSSSVYDFMVGGNLVYMSQNDPRWKDLGFKDGDSIGIYGCGPASLAMITSTVTGRDINPYEAAEAMYQKGLYIPSEGSSHAIMTDGLAHFSVKSEGFYEYSSAAVISELKKGNYFALLTKKGIFSNSTGHFIVLAGLDENGKVLIADSNSVSNSQRSWDIETILSQAKYSASSGGPLWLIQGLAGM